MNDANCPLCAEAGGALVFQAEKFRVIRAQEAGFPAFYRVVWTAHVAEFSSLDVNDRAVCMAAVCAVEQVLREQLQPTKINLAALGNVVPHLHWHVIARFEGDSHFPAPVWGSPQRPIDAAVVAALAARLDEVDDAIVRALSV